MSRPKGPDPGTINCMRATDDEVVMRRMLWRGGAYPGLQRELSNLYAKQSRLLNSVSTLRTCSRANLLRCAIKLVTELRGINQQIEEKKKKIKKALTSRQPKPVFAWQEEVTACVSLAYLAGDTPKTLTEHAREAALANPNRNLELVEQRKREQAAMTPAQFEERMRKPLHPSAVAVPIACSRRHAAQSDKVLALAGKKVNITLRELRDHLRAHGHTPPIDSVRRFLRKTLHVTLRSEQGKRTDLAKSIKWH